MQEEVKHYKVKSLGTTLRPNSVYYVKPNSQTAVLTYITDQTGVPYPLIDLTGVGNIQTVTGTGVTGTASNPIVDISTFNSSQLGNLIQLSSTDGKLFVKPITSPDGSISIVNTLSELQIEVSEALQAQIESALQPGDNVSELTNDAGYITSADVPTNTSDLINDGEDGINPFITAADIVTPSFQDTITVNKTADEVELLYTFFTGGTFTPALSPPGFLLYTIYIKLAQNGGYYVYGNFNGYDGGVSKGIVKILPNGQIDTSFATGNGFNNFPYQGASLLEDDFGKLYVSGAFNTYNSVSNSRIVKLNVDGSIDTSFVVGTGFTGLISGYTNQLAFNVSKTAIYATGLYTNYKGTPINSFARVLINGDLDTSFNVGSGFANSTISVAVNSDDTLFVTTYSTTYKGVAIPNIIKILPNGDRDTSFVSGTGFNTGNNQANYVLKTPDNKIIAAGYFTSYNGTTANRIIKLNQNGTIDSSFDAGSGFNNTVYSIQLVDNNTKYLCNGIFTSYKGVATNGTIVIDLVGNIIVTYVNKYSTSLFINNALLTLSETGTNTGKLVFIKDDIEYLTLNQSLTFDKTNGKAEYNLSPNLVYDDLGENELVPKKFITQSISKTTSFTAVNSGIYNTNGTITITDPAPDTNKGYIVHVIGGTSTIGGVGYTTGSLVYRFFNGTIWISKDYGSIITPVIDANPTDGSSNAVSSNGVFDALAGKEPSITAGTTSQYWRGDKTWQNFPTIPTVGTWGVLDYPTWTTGTPFVKMTAAGTFALDTSTYLTGITSSDVTTALGYTPVTNARTITINGTTFDLTADRSWTISSSGVLPTGGTAGQILTKVDATDYNATWQENYADWTSVVKHTVKNDGTGLITKGTAVYVTGSNGTNMLVGKASNLSEATSSKTMGLMQSDITTTGGTQTGFVITEGLISGLNTAGTVAGDPVWLGVNGALIYGLINKPYAPAHLVFIGIVTKVSAGSGEIFVKVQNGFELKEIHDVDLKTNLPTNNQVLTYESATDLWKNKTIVEDSIANGVTDVAPSQNAVFDALDSLVELNFLRQNNAYIIPLGLVNVQNGFSVSSNIASWGLSLSGNTATGGIGGFVRFDTTATAGTLAFRRGSFGIILGGYQFEYTQKVRFQTNLTGQRGLWGLSAGYTFATPTNVEPNTNVSVVGVCQLSTSTNLHIIHNDASGIATTSDLGANYPCNTNIYTYYIKIKRTTSDYTITVERLTNTDNSIISTTYTTSTNIPAFSLASFSPINYITNNAQSAIASYFDGGCIAKITHQ
jgi:hypothetical protein